MWSREKIIEIAERTGMTETQIYKWWWDQTRKRVKRLKINRAKLESQTCNRTANKEAMA